jgi:hypothetical protein
MTLSGHLARIRANASQPRQTELRNHRPGQVNADEKRLLGRCLCPIAIPK